MSVISRPLLQVFRFHSEASPSANFGRALEALLTVDHTPRSAVTSPNPVTRETADFFVRSMTYNLETAVSGELSVFPARDRVVVASALHTAGLLLLKNGRSPSIPERVAELMRASADFCLFVANRKNQGETAPAERFLYDCLIADTTMSLKGLLDDSCLEPEQRSSLSDVLGRSGVLSGALRWPNVGWFFPNVGGALWTHFGLREEDVKSAEFLFPSSYFLSNTVWRHEPLGDFEHILAKCLENPRLEKARSLSARAVALHAKDPGKHLLVRRFHTSLNDAPDDLERRLGVVSDLAAIAMEDAGGASVPLPAFLLTALETRH